MAALLVVVVIAANQLFSARVIEAVEKQAGKDEMGE